MDILTLSIFAVIVVTLFGYLQYLFRVQHYLAEECYRHRSEQDALDRVRHAREEERRHEILLQRLAECAGNGGPP